MATYDSADLLARLKLRAKFETAGTAPLTDAECYTLLGEGQQEVVLDIATHAPWAMLSTPTLLTSADSGRTYGFGTDPEGNPITPLAVEIYAQLTGRELYACSFSALGGDFVIEGLQIRMPGYQPVIFSAGPYARFVTVPLTLSASREPTVFPIEARPLIVYAAWRKFCRIGGLQDESPAQMEYNDLWLGKPGPGGQRTGGLRDALKLQYRTRMAPATDSGGGRVWWRSFAAGAA